MRHSLSILLLSLIPGSVEAAVTISEVAWMGDAVSANHEWIELYNSDDTAVSLDGWTVTDGENLTISLLGSIGPQTYIVLERTTDESAPGSAFLIYSGALVNTGATLRLYDETATLVDQVAGGEDWTGIGGDNTTKETAQYTPSGWVTAVPTPGAANATKSSSEAPSKNSVSGGSGTVASPESRAPLVLSREPKNPLTLELVIPTTVYVGQKIILSAGITGVGERLLPSTKYQWNFGDTYTALGKSPEHVYEYPGTYVVMVTATVADRQVSTTREVTVLPVTVSMTRNETGAIQLHNDAVYPVDLSGYTLRGTENLTLPPGTVIVPRGTITIASHRLEEVPNQSLVLLRNSDGDSVAYAVPSLLATTDSKETTTDREVISAAIPIATAPWPTVVAAEEINQSPEDQSEALPVQAAVTTGEATPATKETQYYLGLGLLLCAVLVVIWTVPRKIVGPQNTDL